MFLRSRPLCGVSSGISLDTQPDCFKFFAIHLALLPVILPRSRAAAHLVTFPASPRAAPARDATLTGSFQSDTRSTAPPPRNSALPVRKAPPSPETPLAVPARPLSPAPNVLSALSKSPV